MSGHLKDINQDIASLLLDLAEVYHPSPQYWGYKRASRAIRRHPQFLSELQEREILQIPGIGPTTLRIVREFLNEGYSITVEWIISKRGKTDAIEKKRALRDNFMSAAMVAKILAEKRQDVIGRDDYLGDFQMHSVGSDGADTLEALVEGCRKRGYRLSCITDHSYGLPIAAGVNMEKFRMQRAEINLLNRKHRGDFRLLRGVEANILQDGSLDMQPDELRELELVMAAPHSLLRKTIDQTPRLLAAVSFPGVHILGHPRGRIFNLRAGVVADWKAVFRKAADTGVAVEIDGDVSRQDLDFGMAAEAQKAGCLFALDSDAHAADQLWMADYAIAHARLAGIPAERVVNCWPVENILEWAAKAWDR